MDELLSSCWEETVDAGPYELADGAKLDFRARRWASSWRVWSYWRSALELVTDLRFRQTTN